MTATEELLSQKLAAQHQNAVLLEENTRLRADNARLQAIVNPLCELHGCTAELVVEWCKRDAAENKRLREALESTVKDSLTVRARLEILRVAAEDMLSTYRHDDKTVIVTAERQEAWAEAIKKAKL